MTSTVQNFTMWSGDSKDLIVTVTDGTTAVDITGATVNYQLQTAVNDITQKITKATGGSGIVLTTPASGIFTITLAASDTAGFAGRYYHEAQVTNTSSKVATVFVGQVTINEDAV